MKYLGYILASIIGVGIGYAIGKKKSSLGSPRLSGLGVGGSPRMGVPKAAAERLATHKSRFGGEELPPRGTGISKRF